MNSLDEYDSNPDEVKLTSTKIKNNAPDWLSILVGVAIGMTLGACVLSWMVIKEII